MHTIPFNRASVVGREVEYLAEAVASGKLSGDGPFTKRCQQFFESRYGIARALLTTSCTDALELAALLLGVGPGDEVVVPSFTFVSSANAFALRGAQLVFADSSCAHPNMDVGSVEPLLTPRTKVIVPVHYAGVACDMDPLLELAKSRSIHVVEDAAHAVDAFYKGRPLGRLGALGTFSFHDTKNIVAGEGGLLAVNDPALAARAEILREKGTNRSAFYRGEVDRYGWVDVGSSFLPSELTAAFLFGQLEQLERVQSRRVAIWRRYTSNLSGLTERFGVTLPEIPHYATNNAHMYFLRCRDLAQRTRVIEALKSRDIHATFHYLPLHTSAYYLERHDGRDLPNSRSFADRLLRLPLFYSMTDEQVDGVSDALMTSLRECGA
jgi:dTDP-4-amino-4,6-dideoxygalactose transaminase